MSALLEVRDLDVYYGAAQALTGVSLDVPRGEIVAIVGTNGAGKSTLIRAIAGIDRPSAGRVIFGESEITGLDTHKVCNLGIGQVAEGRELFPSLTVLENLQMGAMVRQARANVMQTLEEVFTLFPRLAERRKQLAGTLSGGEQQMLAIGRCLMSRPELMLLTSPLSDSRPISFSSCFIQFACFSKTALPFYWSNKTSPSRSRSRNALTFLKTAVSSCPAPAASFSVMTACVRRI